MAPAATHLALALLYKRNILETKDISIGQIDPNKAIMKTVC